MPYYVKAIYAGLVTFLASLLTAVQAGELSTASWLTIILATIVAVGGVLGLQAAPASISTSVR